MMHPKKERTAATKELWLEYKQMHIERKRFFNYKVKQHGDRQKKY